MRDKWIQDQQLPCWKPFPTFNPNQQRNEEVLEARVSRDHQRGLVVFAWMKLTPSNLADGPED